MNQLFTFTDVIKKGFLELDAFQAMSPLRIVIALSITLLIGLFIYFVYGISYRGVVYNRSFSAVLVLMSLITSMIIMTVVICFSLENLRIGGGLPSKIQLQTEIWFLSFMIISSE